MIYTETSVRGSYIIDLERREDSRGFFARSWCQREFEGQGLNGKVAQINLAVSKQKGTVRGLHFQLAPHEEAKTVCCTRGAIFDVVVDLRPDSPTFRKWAAVELTAGNQRRLYVPPGCATGYQTLVDDTEISYQASEFYAPEHARGVRYNDQAFGIEWPLAVTSISDADRKWPDFLTTN